MNDETFHQATDLRWHIAALEEAIKELKAAPRGFVKGPVPTGYLERPETTAKVRRILLADLRGQLRKARRKFANI